MVALQALAQYGYLTFSKTSLNTVEVHFMDSPSKIFQVNDKNRFLLQQASLPTIPGSYSVEVNGTGCVYLQVSKLGTQHHPLGTEQGALRALFICTDHARDIKPFKSVTISRFLSLLDHPEIQHPFAKKSCGIFSVRKDSKCVLHRQLSTKVWPCPLCQVTSFHWPKPLHSQFDKASEKASKYTQLTAALQL